MVKAKPRSASNSDVRDALERVLSSTAYKAGGYSFRKTYLEPPNPFLQVEGLGVIGMPLSSREAKVIRAHVGQAASGSRIIIPTQKIAVANPRWADFMDSTIKDVCQVFDIDHEGNRPQYQFSGLILDETGSNSLPHLDTRKSDGVFATLIILLPSEFTGGEIHLSHESIDLVYDNGPTSSNATNVMAWFNDVTPETKPIKGGYRLALSYNLVRSATSLCPTIPSNLLWFKEALLALRLWPQSAAPKSREKIVYLLQHYYSPLAATIRDGIFKGFDGTKVSLLVQATEQVGFSVGLATVVCHLSGEADGIFDDRCDENADQIDFEEIQSREMTFEGFIDSHGTKISGTLKVNEKTEVIPANLAEEIEDADRWDSQECDSFGGTDTLQRWYRRTVVVIWPNKNDSKVTSRRVAKTSSGVAGPIAQPERGEPSAKKRKTGTA